MQRRQKTRQWFCKCSGYGRKEGLLPNSNWGPAAHCHHLGHRWQTQGLQAEFSPPPCFIRPAPCFYPGAVPSSYLTVKEQLHVYSPKIALGPLKAAARLLWPRVKMSLTPLIQAKFQRQRFGDERNLLFFVFIIFFLLLFSSLIHSSPQQSPHCCPCP